MKKIIGGLVLLSFIFNCAYAQKPAVVTGKEKGWYKIGETTASFKKQNESIVVMGKDEFASLKLRISDAPIHIERMIVHYEGGEVQEIDLKNELKAGEESRVIQLDASNKEINKVSFTYKTLPNRRDEKAEVELYGFKAQRDNSNEAYREEKRELKKETREAREEMKEGADRVGDDVSEAASKTAAAVKDKIHDDKVGPQNQTIYIDKETRYYYIDNQGNKVYVTKQQLKDKPEDD